MVGNLLSLTDPVFNTTTWTYDRLNRVTKERNALNKDRLWEYDAASNVTEYTDRNGRVTEYDYDNLHRRTTETWLDGMSVVNTLEYEYDAASQLLNASDDFSEYDYAYDALGRVTEIITAHSGLLVKFNQAYNANGQRTELAAAIHDGTSYVDDFVNDYAYDNLGRMTGVTQAGVLGGSAVAEKRVDFSYNAAGQFTGIDRFADLAGTALVAATSYTYDGIGRLTSLTHEKDTTTFADYGWSYDAFSRVTQFTFDSLIGGPGQSDYTYDETGQLTAADHDYQTDESYEYDENGNRTGTGYTNTTDNRVLSDGTYNYQYDDEGNLTRETTIATGDYTEYTFDHRNRLVAVEFRDDQDVLLKRVEFDYDVWNRRIAKRVDSNGDSTFDQALAYIYDDGGKRDPGTGVPLDDVVLVLDDSGSLISRELHGPGFDQILASEFFSPTTAGELPLAPGDLYWALADNQGTVRDLAEYDALLDETNIVNHIDYDSFGNIRDESATAADYLLSRFRYSYTGQDYDADADMHYYLNRWYSPRSGSFISKDPIGFAAGDTNLSRYVGNSPTNGIDPSGLQEDRPVDLGRYRLVELTLAQPEVMKQYMRIYGKEGLEKLYTAFSWGYEVSIDDDWSDDPYTIDCSDRSIVIDEEITAFWSGDEETSVMDRAKALFNAVSDSAIVPPKTMTPGMTSAGDSPTALDPNKTRHHGFSDAGAQIRELFTNIRNDILLELAGAGIGAAFVNKLDNLADIGVAAKKADMGSAAIKLDDACKTRMLKKTDDVDDILVRQGKSRESATRLAKQAEAAEKGGSAQNGVPYGHGVSVTTPASNAKLAKNPLDAVSAPRKAIEDAGFDVRHTPTRRDPNHHTVQLPKPVTKEVADTFNDVFGR